MSLTEPTLLDRVRPHWKLIAVIAGLLVVLGLVLWLFASVDNWSFNRGQRKTKEQIANTAKEIANIQTQITDLEKQKAEKQGELHRDMEQLQKEIYGREEAKQATNAALANFQNAVNSNSNVDRTAEDLERILREVEK